MPKKIDEDATTGNKLLRLFRKLMISHGRHYMTDLARELKCSPQTVGRLMMEIENELGAQIESGMDSHKKWYRFCSNNSNSLGLDTEEIRYLSICKDLATPYLSEDISTRIDKLILKISIQHLGEDKTEQEFSKIFEPEYSFYAKGFIDYTPYVNTIAKLERAVREKTILDIEYRSTNSNRKKKILFCPKQFISHSGALYVLGASIKENTITFEKLKTLLVHRIENIEKTANTADFVLPTSNLSDFGLPWLDEPVTFTIIFIKSSAVNYVKERVWSHHQEIKDLPNGELELKIKTKSAPEVLAWCRGFGDRIREVWVNETRIDNIMSNDYFSGN